ncbi:division plane positioning ATPase MipZ [Spirosoma jeollabukense]
MTKAVSFSPQKGGPGKTTMTILSATYLNSIGANVAVINTDFPQHSFLRTRDKDLLDQQNKPAKKMINRGRKTTKN